MAKPLPKWMQTRYAALWKKFTNKQFTYKQAEKVLKDKSGLNVFFSELRKSEWIEVSLDSKDSRYRILKLKSPDDIFKKMTK